ncbi:MAG: hypothetical protein WBC93_17820 [Sulfitobacter sp.]
MAPKEGSGKQRPFVEVSNAAKRAKAEHATPCINCAEQYLSDRQVALRFDVSKATIWRWHDKNPNFPRRIRLSPGTSRWKLSDLVKFEQSVQVKDTSSTATSAKWGVR